MLWVYTVPLEIVCIRQWAPVELIFVVSDCNKFTVEIDADDRRRRKPFWRQSRFTETQRGEGVSSKRLPRAADLPNQSTDSWEPWHGDRGIMSATIDTTKRDDDDVSIILL